MTWFTIELERRFADPSHHPGWKAAKRPADKRPPWTVNNEAGKLAFIAWLHRQLDELDQRVLTDRRRELETAITPSLLKPSLLKQFADGLMASLPFFQGKVEGLRLAEPHADINRMCELERLRELDVVGRGRPASGADPNSPTALAARDMWRIRQVILPRFWPEGTERGMGPGNAELASIAAKRQNDLLSKNAAVEQAVKDKLKVSAKAALNWYKNEGVASF